MLKDKENSRKQGDVGLGSAISYFTRNGYTVCIPLTDSQKYDLIIENGEGLKKVQVKTTYSKRYNYIVTVATSGGNKSGSKIYPFDPKNADYLFALTEVGDKYLIPSDVVPKRTINLGKLYEKYKIT